MDLYPAIDLRDGKAVRLLRGDYNKMTVYGDVPLNTAKSFEDAGAKYLHVVDLDGAKDGGTPNFELIKSIVKNTSLKVEVGGGIRSLDVAQKYLDAGVMRVILGTAAVTDPDFLEAAVASFADAVAVGVDLRDGMVATHGWTQSSELSGLGFCQRLQDLAVKTLICTDISRDGAMQGVNERLYMDLCSRFDMEIIASGGVTTIDDLVILSHIGASGAILGKSLYTGSIDLRKAVEAVGKADKK